MPGYVSHIVMARDVYKKIKNHNVSLDYMLTFSLGGDLSKYAKCRYNSHHKYQNEFIYKMADYIKEQKLIDDSESLGVLYGHICHYVMDNLMHPLIKKIDKLCIKNKINHTLIEGYIDSYLVKYKYDIGIDKYDNKEILRGKVNKKIGKMLDYVYVKMYNCKRVSLYYKFNLWLYRKIRYLYKIFGTNLLKKISKFNKFMDDNKNIDLLNSDRLIKYKLVDGKECNKDLITLYDDSVNIACEYIATINKYLKNTNT